jgi:hypothetical protein
MQDSNVVTGLEVRGIMVWFSAVTVDTSYLQVPDRRWAHPALYSVCNQALFLGIWSGQGVKLKNVHVKEVKNE